MNRGGARGPAPAMMALSVLLLLAGVWVRGIQVRLPPAPADRLQSGPRIAEPMQLLSRGAAHRYPELGDWVSEGARARWRTASAFAFELAGCPPLKTWLDGRDGQRIERLLADLRAGTREDAFAALVVIFQLARSTEWRPGVGGRAEHAEALGGLLADWLRGRAEGGADDALLHEPALAAALLYGRAMHVAWNAPLVGYNTASFERARGVLATLCGVGRRERTAFGRELAARYGRVFAALDATEPARFFAPFRAECELLFPELDGACSR